MNALVPGGLSADLSSLGALGGVEVRLTVEVGAVRLTLAEIAAFVPGSVVELDRRSDERVDILVNDRLLAKGEVVTIGDRFGIRILELAGERP